MKFIVAALSLLMLAGFASADTVTGFSNVTVDNSNPDLVFLSSLTWQGGTYTPDDFIYGETTRWWLHETHRRPDRLWLEGTPVPADLVPVPDTSNPKELDVGSLADNNIWKINPNVGTTSADISSLDGIHYQETLFADLQDTIFVFERGGNDNGTIQAILEDDSLGPAFELIKGGAPYERIGNYSGQTDYGYVYQADAPIKGIRISAPGHDSLSILVAPEPATLSLIGLAGLILLARRRR